MIAGIILAAGASSRMGSPKALLDYRGETFVNRLVRVLSGVCDQAIVVLGYHAETIRPQVRGQVQMVVNPDPDRGQLSSLQTGLAMVPSDAEGFLFIPVDCPAAEPETIVRLAAALRGRDPATRFVIPSFHGKHGHPVCAAGLLRQEFLALPPTGQAREIVHRHVEQTVYLDVEDPGVLTDIDDPTAYRHLAEKAV